MKRTMAMFLAFVVVLSLAFAGSAFAELNTPVEFDLLGIQSSGLTVTSDGSDNCLFFSNGYTCLLDFPQSKDPGSYEYSQIMAYLQEDASWRGVMWICFVISTDEAANINEVSFRLEDEVYTFHDLYSEDNIFMENDYVFQNIPILIGMNNQSFLVKLYNLVAACDEDAVEDLCIPVTLRGAQNIETTIDGIACVDILSMDEAMQIYGGSFDDILGTELTVEG